MEYRLTNQSLVIPWIEIVKFLDFYKLPLDYPEISLDHLELLRRSEDTTTRGKKKYTEHAHKVHRACSQD